MIAISLLFLASRPGLQARVTALGARIIHEASWAAVVGIDGSVRLSPMDTNAVLPDQLAAALNTLAPPAISVSASTPGTELAGIAARRDTALQPHAQQEGGNRP